MTILEKHSLGRFELKSGSLLVIDPCYDGDEGQTIPAAKGDWEAYVLKAKISSPWGQDYRSALLWAHLAGQPFDYDEAVWQPLEAGTGVDSGQAGIFDPQFYRDDSQVTEPLENRLTGESLWYDLCCERTLGDLGAGLVPYGCVSSSGYGDGYYSAFGVWKKEKLVAVAIHFQVAFSLAPAMQGEEAKLWKALKENNLKDLQIIVNQALANEQHQSFSAEGFLPDVEELHPNYPHFNDLFFTRAAQYSYKDEFLLALLHRLPTAGRHLDLNHIIESGNIALWQQLDPYIHGPISDFGLFRALCYLGDEATALEFSKLLVAKEVDLHAPVRWNWEQPFLFRLFSNVNFHPKLAEFWLEQGLDPRSSHGDKKLWEVHKLSKAQLDLLRRYAPEVPEFVANTEEDKNAQAVENQQVEEVEASEEADQDPNLNDMEALVKEAQSLMDEINELVNDVLKKSKKGKKSKKSKKQPKKEKDGQKSDKKSEKNSKEKPIKTQKLLLLEGAFQGMNAKLISSDGDFYLVEIKLFGKKYQQEVHKNSVKKLKN